MHLGPLVLHLAAPAIHQLGADTRIFCSLSYRSTWFCCQQNRILLELRIVLPSLLNTHVDLLSLFEQTTYLSVHYFGEGSLQPMPKSGSADPGRYTNLNIIHS